MRLLGLLPNAKPRYRWTASGDPSPNSSGFLVESCHLWCKTAEPPKSPETSELPTERWAQNEKTNRRNGSVERPTSNWRPSNWAVAAIHHLNLLLPPTKILRSKIENERNIYIYCNTFHAFPYISISPRWYPKLLGPIRHSQPWRNTAHGASRSNDLTTI